MDRGTDPFAIVGGGLGVDALVRWLYGVLSRGDAGTGFCSSFGDSRVRIEGADVVMWRWLRLGVASCELTMTIRIVLPGLGARRVVILSRVNPHGRSKVAWSRLRGPAIFIWTTYLFS